MFAFRVVLSVLSKAVLDVQVFPLGNVYFLLMLSQKQVVIAIILMILT